MNQTYTVSSERLYEDVASEKKQALCKVEEVSAKMTILMSKSEGKKKSEHSKRRGQMRKDAEWEVAIPALRTQGDDGEQMLCSM